MCAAGFDDQRSRGIVNDIHKFDVNKIDIKASSAAINDKMLENLS